MKLLISWTLRFFRFLDSFLEKVVFDILLAPTRRAWTLGALGFFLTGWLLLGSAPHPPSAQEMEIPALGLEIEEFQKSEPLQEADPVKELSDTKRWLYKRPWIDHVPKDSHDPVLLLVFDQRSVGVVAQLTRFRGNWEMFKYRAGEKDLLLVFPHDQRKFKTGYTIEEIQGREFDLKLTLHDAGRGGKVFYSSKKHRHGMSLNEILPQKDSLESVLEGFAVQEGFPAARH